MRQLLFQVSCSKAVLQQISSCQGTNLTWRQAGDEPLDFVLVRISYQYVESHQNVERLLGAPQDPPDLNVILLPAGATALHPAAGAA